MSYKKNSPKKQKTKDDYKELYEVSNEQSHNPRDYIGDCSFESSQKLQTAGNTTIEETVCRLEILVGELQEKIRYLERVLAPANIIKATPLVSLVYMDFECKNRVSLIYSNWIKYMNYIARYNLNGLTVEGSFWAIDKYIFDSFFEQEKQVNNKKFHFVSFTAETTFSEEKMSMVKTALYKNRDEANNLKSPIDREYLSTLVSGDEIFVVFFLPELSLILTTTHISRNSTVSSNADAQLDASLNSNLSLNKSVISGLDTNAIGIHTTSDNLLRLDKRLIMLGSQRALYNTVVDTQFVNMFNTNLYGMGIPSLNITLMVFHAMLHIKCDLKHNGLSIDTNRHGNDFLTEFINYTPSVLFGHAMFPPLSIDDDTTM